MHAVQRCKLQQVNRRGANVDLHVPEISVPASLESHLLLKPNHMHAQIGCDIDSTSYRRVKNSATTTYTSVSGGVSTAYEILIVLEMSRSKASPLAAWVI